MPVKRYKPTSAGRRLSSVQDFSDITTTEPVKALTVRLKNHAGRNQTGKITVRHREGRKRLYRLLDFARLHFDIPATVTEIEYDPNRNARIARIQYKDGALSYMLAPQGVKQGDVVLSSANAIEPKVGNRMPLASIPPGLFVHAIELSPMTKGILVRGAGTGAQLQTIEGRFAQLKLPSGEIRLVPKECLATIGMVGNADYRLIRWGKAGRRRHLGWRPTVRGKVMNPVDHPHGGGEGRNPIGLRGGPKTKWGKKALGVKTRKAKKAGSPLILHRRKGSL